MNILSLFDGISCGRLALERAGIKVDKYYRSEVDKYANIIAKKNYPDSIDLGDVKNVDGAKLGKIDLLIGGSPCTNLSFAGKRQGCITKEKIEITMLEQYLQLKKDGFEFEGQSYLFWEYMRILKELRINNPNILFLLENVKMHKKWENVFTKAIGVAPIEINSSLVSAQNRKRLYWTNIPNIIQPEDKGIMLKDIVFDDALFVGRMVGRKIDENGVRKDYSNIKPKQRLELRTDNKSGTITTVQKDNTVLTKEGYVVCMHNLYGGFGEKEHRTFTEKSPTIRAASGGGAIPSLLLSKKALDYMDRKVKGGRNHWDFKHHSDIRNNKASTVVANFFKGVPYNVLKDWNCIRNFHPIECERLQTISDDFTKGVSTTQRLKMLGNAWTVDVIAHILSFIPEKK